MHSSTSAPGFFFPPTPTPRLMSWAMGLLLLLAWVLSSCATSKPGSAIQKQVQGKTYVIIGASSGFGRGMAEQLGTMKANVVLAARRTELLEEVATKIRASGGQALVVTTDISKPEQVQNLADAAMKQFGRVDVWVNDVGVGGIGRFWEIPLNDYSQMIDVNLKGIIYGSQAAIKIFQTQGSGTLMNLGSVESEVPLAYHAVYASTKGAIRNLDQALNNELRLNGYKNIKVVTIEPWAVDTPFWGHAANYSGGTPRMAAMDPPSKVVNAMVRSSVRPRQELPVGWKARGAFFSHNIMPHFTERLSANIIHRYQVKTAPPAPTTTASLYQPVPTGRGVDDGVKPRIKAENRQRKQKKQ
ncbi:SDR family NAD(P)-dependent oxidoreductase [Hymenobacter cellulosilyticus]|uniref:SDR family NAD(P)-dependent oxidoreductase n=1 Tax=Hymenobacter cellulosilyticus TaxID=2932248 RepID=A0A8T9Q6X6_9BACT|nr:SDR family NAD(P)-dependent oxidoreductase [Hymenobacter cellulosilyticus]UOQ72702.1 SDR family NAD(P)-dependent oxidoreductase [Hymenobacter cellulosilyticus]